MTDPDAVGSASTIGLRSTIHDVRGSLTARSVVSIVAARGGGVSTVVRAVVAAEAGRRDVVWCDLTSVADDLLVGPVILDALGSAPVQGSDAADAVASAIGGRDVLLVFDHAEQVVGALGRMIVTLVRSCPGLGVLVGSSAPLAIAGERVVEIAPLDPAGDGVALIVAKLRNTRPDAVLPVDPAQLATLAECAAGHPVALGIVAGRLGDVEAVAEAGSLVNEVTELVDGVDDGLATIVDWTLGRLTVEQRDVAERVSLFESSFGVAGAMALVGVVLPAPEPEGFMVLAGDLATDAGQEATEPLTNPEVADRHAHEVGAVLDRLTALGLLQRSSSVSGVRWSMPESLRRRGQRAVTDRTQRAALRNAHLAHLIAESITADTVCRGREYAIGVERFGVIWSDLRAAIAWAIAAQRSDDVDALFAHLAVVGQWAKPAEVAAWAEHAGRRAEMTGASIGAATRLALGRSSSLRGDHERSLQTNLLVVDTAPRPHERSWARTWAAIDLCELGRLGDAALLADAVLVESPFDDLDAAVQLAVHAMVKHAARSIGDADVARVIDQAEALAASSGSPLAVGLVAFYRARIDAAAGRGDDASAGFDRVIEIGRRHGIDLLVRRAAQARQ